MVEAAPPAVKQGVTLEASEAGVQPDRVLPGEVDEDGFQQQRSRRRSSKKASIAAEQLASSSASKESGEPPAAAGAKRDSKKSNLVWRVKVQEAEPSTTSADGVVKQSSEVAPAAKTPIKQDVNSKPAASGPNSTSKGRRSSGTTTISASGRVTTAASKTTPSQLRGRDSTNTLTGRASGAVGPPGSSSGKKQIPNPATSASKAAKEKEKEDRQAEQEILEQNLKKLIRPASPEKEKEEVQMTYAERLLKSSTRWVRSAFGFGSSSSSSSSSASATAEATAAKNADTAEHVANNKNSSAADQVDAAEAAASAKRTSGTFAPASRVSKKGEELPSEQQDAGWQTVSGDRRKSANKRKSGTSVGEVQKKPTRDGSATTDTDKGKKGTGRGKESRKSKSRNSEVVNLSLTDAELPSTTATASSTVTDAAAGVAAKNNKGSRRSNRTSSSSAAADINLGMYMKELPTSGRKSSGSAPRKSVPPRVKTPPLVEPVMNKGTAPLGIAAVAPAVAAAGAPRSSSSTATSSTNVGKNYAEAAARTSGATSKSASVLGNSKSTSKGRAASAASTPAPAGRGSLSIQSPSPPPSGAGATRGPAVEQSKVMKQKTPSYRDLFRGSKGKTWFSITEDDADSPLDTRPKKSVRISTTSVAMNTTSGSKSSIVTPKITPKGAAAGAASTTTSVLIGTSDASGSNAVVPLLAEPSSAGAVSGGRRKKASKHQQPNSEANADNTRDSSASPANKEEAASVEKKPRRSNNKLPLYRHEIFAKKKEAKMKGAGSCTDCEQAAIPEAGAGAEQKAEAIDGAAAAAENQPPKKKKNTRASRKRPKPAPAAEGEEETAAVTAARAPAGPENAQELPAANKKSANKPKKEKQPVAATGKTADTDAAPAVKTDKGDKKTKRTNKGEGKVSKNHSKGKDKEAASATSSKKGRSAAKRGRSRGTTDLENLTDAEQVDLGEAIAERDVKEGRVKRHRKPKHQRSASSHARAQESSGDEADVQKAAVKKHLPTILRPPQSFREKFSTAAQHAAGLCTPCQFYHTKTGCKNGADCKFCHLCPKGVQQAYKKTKKRLLNALSYEQALWCFPAQTMAFSGGDGMMYVYYPPDESNGYAGAVAQLPNTEALQDPTAAPVVHEALRLAALQASGTVVDYVDPSGAGGSSAGGKKASSSSSSSASAGVEDGTDDCDKSSEQDSAVVVQPGHDNGGPLGAAGLLVGQQQQQYNYQPYYPTPLGYSTYNNPAMFQPWLFFNNSGYGPAPGSFSQYNPYTMPTAGSVLPDGEIVPPPPAEEEEEPDAAEDGSEEDADPTTSSGDPPAGAAANKPEDVVPSPAGATAGALPWTLPSQCKTRTSSDFQFVTSSTDAKLMEKILSSTSGASPTANKSKRPALLTQTASAGGTTTTIAADPNPQKLTSPTNTRRMGTRPGAQKKLMSGGTPAGGNGTGTANTSPDQFTFSADAPVFVPSASK
ncbi:unnamed protein product [Amoebophrya sp. A120]|nr:unnamed protein product [Amoebophrya sp. A120]|eukprot:GSA120T00019981001.1